ncbi:MAG: pyridoxal-dependent decarboxylase [Gemmatimonadota bacterium]|nr:pyridoxal-dependent decarboxylase [Gemmatimonadota bacterium]
MDQTLRTPAFPGDMDPEEFRHHGRAAVDWIAAYLREIERYPVLAQVQPGEIAAQLPVEAPEHGVPMEAILADFQRTLLPGITHWNHPGFMAYFGITASGPGIVGEALAAALNVNAMLWRTSPAATELEERALDWLRQMIGLPAAFRGHIQDTASLSTLVAIAGARESAGLDVREHGLAALPRMRLYCSEEAHSSVEKAAITLGLGRAGVRKIPTGDAFRMRVDALSAAIQEDTVNGWRPFCVVATVGTTSTTSVDPVPEIAEVCARERLWLHVDAAYGGAVGVVPEMRHLLAGCDRADSLVVNPHKWLFVPIDCSALYLRRPESVRRAFSLVPDYLQTPEGEGVTNLMDYGPALGRRFRALKLWMTLCYFGREGLAERIREHCRLAREFASWVDAEPGWERMAPVPMSVVVFRRSGEDALNETILERVNASGEVFLSHTRVHGQYALRLAVGNLRTTQSHVARAWELLRKAQP